MVRDAYHDEAVKTQPEKSAPGLGARAGRKPGEKIMADKYDETCDCAVIVWTGFVAQIGYTGC